MFYVIFTTYWRQPVIITIWYYQPVMASLWCRWASFLKNEKCVVAISFCPFIWYITRYDFLKFFPRSTMTLSANNKDQGQMLSQPTVLNVPKGLVCYMKFEGCPLKKNVGNWFSHLAWLWLWPDLHKNLITLSCCWCLSSHEIWKIYLKNCGC